ncbi:hypothetical protein HDU67_007948 [Dinochytrium kinnereticum]|nr:hypothetical protein HDU67_007948 [Dinochytrium kinnereticum]
MAYPLERYPDVAMFSGEGPAEDVTTSFRLFFLRLSVYFTQQQRWDRTDPSAPIERFLTDAEQVAYAVSRFTPGSRAETVWLTIVLLHQNQPNTHSPPKDLKSLREILADTFDPRMERDTWIARMESLKQGDRIIEEFGDEFRRLLALEPPGSRASEWDRRRFYKRAITSPRLLEHLKKYEDDNPACNVSDLLSLAFIWSLDNKDRVDSSAPAVIESAVHPPHRRFFSEGNLYDDRSQTQDDILRKSYSGSDLHFNSEGSSLMSPNDCTRECFVLEDHCQQSHTPGLQTKINESVLGEGYDVNHPPIQEFLPGSFQKSRDRGTESDQAYGLSYFSNEIFPPGLHIFNQDHLCSRRQQGPSSVNSYNALVDSEVDLKVVSPVCGVQPKIDEKSTVQSSQISDRRLQAHELPPSLQRNSKASAEEIIRHDGYHELNNVEFQSGHQSKFQDSKGSGGVASDHAEGSDGVSGKLPTLDETARPDLHPKFRESSTTLGVLTHALKEAKLIPAKVAKTQYQGSFESHSRPSGVDCNAGGTSMSSNSHSTAAGSSQQKDSPASLSKHNSPRSRRRQSHGLSEQERSQYLREGWCITCRSKGHPTHMCDGRQDKSKAKVNAKPGKKQKGYGKSEKGVVKQCDEIELQKDDNSDGCSRDSFRKKQNPPVILKAYSIPSPKVTTTLPKSNALVSNLLCPEADEVILPGERRPAADVVPIFMSHGRTDSKSRGGNNRHGMKGSAKSRVEIPFAQSGMVPRITKKRAPPPVLSAGWQMRLAEEMVKQKEAVGMRTDEEVKKGTGGMKRNIIRRLEVLAHEGVAFGILEKQIHANEAFRAEGS